MQQGCMVSSHLESFIPGEHVNYHVLTLLINCSLWLNKCSSMVHMPAGGEEDGARLIKASALGTGMDAWCIHNNTSHN